MDLALDVVEPGKVPDGVTEVPFEFLLPEGGLHESYHGYSLALPDWLPLKSPARATAGHCFHRVYINVEYKIIVECERGVMMKRALHRSLEVTSCSEPWTCDAEFTTPSFMPVLGGPVHSGSPRASQAGERARWL